MHAPAAAQAPLAVTSLMMVRLTPQLAQPVHTPDNVSIVNYT